MKLRVDSCRDVVAHIALHTALHVLLAALGDPPFMGIELVPATNV